MTTFYAFDSGSKIRATNATGAELASFNVNGDKSSFTITRQLPNAAPVQFCNADRSSMSGTTTMNVHGQQVTYRSSLEYVLEMPQGKFKWTGSSSRERELVDSNRQIVGVANLEASKFDVLVNGDEMFLDCLLAGWTAFALGKKQDAKDAKVLTTGFKIIGALAGGGGGA